MIEWFVAHPWITGIATFFLMWSDWLLTILQERECQLHYAEHYQSYPVNTIEGSPLYQSSVKARRIAEPKHLIPALILSALVVYALVWIPQNFQVAFIGYVWGLFLIVDMTHLGNFIGYQAGRHGLHGKQILAPTHRLSHSNGTLSGARCFPQLACSVFRTPLYCGSCHRWRDVRR
jgi:hypothetical protein